MKNPLSKQEISQLRKRLQACERRIIETANWDTYYFYDGSLPSEQYDKMIELLRRRRKLLNWMCVYTENEIRRIEELDTILTDTMRQMYADLNNLHAGRLAMSDMGPYNDSTWLKARLSYNYDGRHPVLKMEEEKHDLCLALLGLLSHPIYSVPDILRMNSFKVKMVMEQERILL